MPPSTSYIKKPVATPSAQKQSVVMPASSSPNVFYTVYSRDMNTLAMETITVSAAQWALAMYAGRPVDYTNMLYMAAGGALGLTALDAFQVATAEKKLVETKTKTKAGVNNDKQLVNYMEIIDKDLMQLLKETAAYVAGQVMVTNWLSREGLFNFNRLDTTALMVTGGTVLGSLSLLDIYKNKMSTNDANSA